MITQDRKFGHERKMASIRGGRFGGEAGTRIRAWARPLGNPSTRYSLVGGQAKQSRAAQSQWYDGSMTVLASVWMMVGGNTAARVPPALRSVIPQGGEGGSRLPLFSSLPRDRAL